MSGGSARVPHVQPVSTRLPDDLADMLRAEAKRQGTGITELLREGALLRLALAGTNSPDVGGLLNELQKIERRLMRDR